jgi:hypothetical protein
MRDKLHALYTRADDISMMICVVCKRQPHDEGDISKN